MHRGLLGERRGHYGRRLAADMTTNPTDLLLGRLDDVREVGHHRWRARCPAHKGKSRSLSICEAGAGRLLVHCFASCDIANVLDAIGLTAAHLFPRGGRTHQLPDSKITPTEALACVDHEIRVAHLIISDILASGGTVDHGQAERLTTCIERISAARSLSFPAKARTTLR